MDDWFSVDISDPGADYWNMEPIQQTWDNSTDYSYDMPTYDYSNYDYSTPTYDYGNYDYSTPSYDYTNYDSTAFDPSGNYDTNYDYSTYTPGYNGDYSNYDYGNYGPTPQGGNIDSGIQYGPTPEGGNIDSGIYAPTTMNNGGGLYGPTPQGGNIDSGVLYGPTPGGGNIDSTGGTYGQTATGPRMPGQTQQGYPQQPGQTQQGYPQQQGQQSLLQKAVGAVTGTGGGGTGGGGSSLMDSLFPMLLAGGAGYLLSSLIGSKGGSSGAAPGGSIGAFGVNQAALSPTTPLNVPTQGTRTGLQPAWGTAGAPSAQSLGFNPPGTYTLAQPSTMGGASPMQYNFQNTMQAPQLPAPQQAMAPQLPAPQQAIQTMPANVQQFSQDLTPQPVAPLDINNVNFGQGVIPGYTPPQGAPISPDKINGFLNSLMG